VKAAPRKLKTLIAFQSGKPLDCGLNDCEPSSTEAMCQGGLLKTLNCEHAHSGPDTGPYARSVRFRFGLKVPEDINRAIMLMGIVLHHGGFLRKRSYRPSKKPTVSVPTIPT
jgi:hypothetical protein